jgi:hypothetical protein
VTKRQSHPKNESTVNNELAMNDPHDTNDENLCPLPLTAPPARLPSIASAAGEGLPSIASAEEGAVVPSSTHRGLGKVARLPKIVRVLIPKL